MNESHSGPGSAIAWIGGLLALGGLASTFTGAGPEKARFLLAAGGLLFSTGYAALRLTRWRTWGEGTFSLALAFPVSCVLLFAPLFAGELWGAGTAPLRWLARPYLAAAAIVLLREAAAARPRFAAPHPLPLLALAAALIAAGRGGLLTWPSDGPDHVAMIREIQATGESFPITSYYARSTDQAKDARKGFLFGAAAVAANETGAGAETAYDSLPALAAAFFLLALYALAREALGAGGGAVLASSYGFLSWDGGPLGVWFARSGSPYLFSGPLVWAALLVMLRASKGKGAAPAAALASGFALMAVHIYGAFTALLLGGLFVLALFFVPRGENVSRRSAVAALAFVAAGCLPVALWRYAATYPPLDPIHTHLQGILRFSDHLYTANPLIAFRPVGLFGLSGFVLSLFLLRRARRETGILFAVSVTLLPFLVILNPWIVPLLVPFVGYLLGRIVWFGGHWLVLGAVTAMLAGAAVRRGGAVRTAAIAALLALHGLFAGSLWAGDAGLLGRPTAGNRFRLADHPGPERWRDLFDYMGRELPARATVATDPITGYLIPAFTPQKTVAIRAQHSSPADPYAPARLDDMVRAMSPYIDGVETEGILSRRKADYVLLNFRLDRPVVSYAATLDPALYGATLEKFRREPGRYVEIWSADRCHLFEFHEDAPGVPSEEPVLSMLLDRPPPAARPMDEPFPNGVRLVGVEAGPASAAPGETLEIVCYWVRVLDTTDPLPYRTYLRLVLPDAGAGDSWWAKPSRRLKEAVSGGRTRARTMRSLARGAYPTRAWPRTAVVADTLRWTVPRNLEEGSYELQVRLRRSPVVQVFEIADFLRETDSFSGAPAATVEIRRGGSRSPSAARPAAGGEERNVPEHEYEGGPARPAPAGGEGLESRASSKTEERRPAPSEE
ncbi:MAG: hypothetical protein ABIK65_01355 [Candidatus Eisenbacteria bacterium]